MENGEGVERLRARASTWLEEMREEIRQGVSDPDVREALLGNPV